MKNEQNGRILHDICHKNSFPEFWRAIPDSIKLRLSGLDPNINYIIMMDIVQRAQSIKSCYIKLFMRLLTLLYSISLDA